MRTAGFLALAAVLPACNDSSHMDDGSNGPLPSLACGDIAQRPWCDSSLTPQQRTNLLLAAMTLDQKFALMAGDDPLGVVTGDPATGTVDGIPELGIKNLYMSDGPMGPREGNATGMPSPLTLGATFDVNMAARIGGTISDEVLKKGNDLLHAPTVDVMRTALAGRTFETWGEDPYLSARLAAPWINAAQANGVIANVKHFIMNTQEGQVGVPPLTSVIGGRQQVHAAIDERTLREIYMPPFESAVKEANVGSVMCSYNYVNEPPACSSEHLIQDVLRDEWGFDGFIVSDYVLAIKDTNDTARHGAEIEMPIAVFYQPVLLQLAVISGQVSEQEIDTRVGNILRTLFRFGVFDRPEFPVDDSLIDQAAHAQVAREYTEQGMVMLKNDGTLPLGPALKSLAIIGAPAETYHDPGGSASVQPFHYVTPREVLTQRAGAGVTVMYDDGSDPAASATNAAGADAAIVFVEDKDQEGVDKTCLSLDCPTAQYLPNLQTPQEDLIAAVSAANPHTVVVLVIGGPVLTPFRDSVGAILAAWYPGQEAGAALARVIFGDTDPGGRLPATFPNAEGETPTANNPLQYPGVANQALYTEGVFTGYRWYDENTVAPAYEFGFGLSYTQFAFSDLQTSVSDGAVSVSAVVRNTGARGGWAVPQLYASLPDVNADVRQPPRQLKGFHKLWLEPGQQQRVEFALDSRALSYWNVDGNDWRVAPGCYAVHVGSSSRQLPLSRTFNVGSDGHWLAGFCQ